MIHLDRNHHPSPLSPHSNSNLILPTPHPDQLKLLARSPLAHDDKPVLQETVSTNTTVNPESTAVPSIGEEVRPGTPPVVQPPTEEPPTEPHPASPNGRKSSPLSPPSDAGS